MVREARRRPPVQRDGKSVEARTDCPDVPKAQQQKGWFTQESSPKSNYRFEAVGTARGFLAFISFRIAANLGYP